MSTLLILVKILSSLYQARKVNDKPLCDEIFEIFNEIEVSKNDVFTQDKKVEIAIRDAITWIMDQSFEEPIIKSMLVQRIFDMTRDAPELRKVLEAGLEDYPTEERTRQIIFKHIKEIRKAQADNKFNKDFKTGVKDAYFGDPCRMDKAQLAKLTDLLESKMKESYLDDTSVAMVEEVNSDDVNSFVKIINRSKVESSDEGVIKMGIEGINRSSGPDNGLRRAKFYAWNALTNRGKSLTLSHVLASVGLYNKPLLRDKAKIPTVVLDSAEDSLDIIIERMYKLIMVNKFDHPGDFANEEPETIANVIINAFKDNGWYLVINRVDPVNDNYYEMTGRIRKLEMKGHEVIFWAYDYLAMANLKGCAGESRSDKLQDLYKRVRGFIVNHGICFCTPHQLSPEAKKFLRESDDETELNFAKEVGGKSMTEGSTKLTNEVDGEWTVHVAKTVDDKAYWTIFNGKTRGEGALMSERFWVYNLDPVKGLVHDYGKKLAGRKSFRHMLNEQGENVEDFDFAA